MAKQTVNVGSSENAHNGDILRTAFIKINENFDEIYASLGGTVGSTTQLENGNFTLSLSTSGKVTLSTGLEFFLGNDIDVNHIIKSPNKLTLTATNADWLFAEDGTLTVPGGNLAISANESVNGLVSLNDHPVTIDSMEHRWSFNTDGGLTLPDGLSIKDSTIGYSNTNTLTEVTDAFTTSVTTTNTSQIHLDHNNLTLERKVIQVVDDGVITMTDEAGNVLNVGNAGSYMKSYTEPAGPANTEYSKLGTDAGAYLESKSEDFGGYTLGRVQTDFGNVIITTHSIDDKTWLFDQSGILTLPSNNYLETTDVNLKVGSQGTVTIRSNAASNLTTNEWVFNKLGTLSTPSLLPKSFTATCDSNHLVTQAARPFTPDEWWSFDITFAVFSNGSVETQITNNTPWPSNPGYLENDQFEFTEADHGIPGYTFTLTLVDIQTPSQYMYTTNLAASLAPALPPTIKSEGPAKITVADQNWTFGTGGYFSLPGGTANIISETNSVILEANGLPGYSNLALTETSAQLVSSQDINLVTGGGPGGHWIFGSNGTLTLPQQSETVLNVSDISTAKIYRATNSTDPVAIRSAFDVWYSEETLFNVIVAEDEGIGNTRPWHGMPSWEAYPLILNYNHSGPGLPPPINLPQIAKSASDSYLAWKELESNIDIVSGNKTFSFGNNGILSLPGELTFTDTSNAKIVVGQLEQITWTFGLNDGTGSITFPDGSVQTTAYTGGLTVDRLVNSGKQVVLGSDGVITLPQLAQLNVVGSTTGNLTSLETAYTNAEAAYRANFSAWVSLNNHTPVWYLLPGKDAYQQLAQGDYDGVDWLATAPLKEFAQAASTAYAVWQSSIADSKLTVKSNVAAWTFDSTNKLTLPSGGVVAGGNPADVQTAYDAYQADQAAWYDLITTSGLDTNIRPWHFAGPSREEKLAVVTAMWNTQQEQSAGSLGWVPITASLYNQVRTWLAVVVNQDGYETWKKLTTAVNIVSDDKTWSFNNDGVLTTPDSGKIYTTTELTLSVFDNMAQTQQWTFDRYGGLTFPGNLTISNYTIQGPIDSDLVVKAIDNGSGITAITVVQDTDNNQLSATVLEQTQFSINVDHTGADKTWRFSNDGNLIFPASGVLNIKDYGPAHSYGSPGDKAGMVAFDGSYIYYCKQDYVDNLTNIWVRVVWTDTNW